MKTKIVARSALRLSCSLSQHATSDKHCFLSVLVVFLDFSQKYASAQPNLPNLDQLRSSFCPENIRAIITYELLSGASASAILSKPQYTLGDDAPSRATVYRIVQQIQSGRTDFCDSPRSGRPRTATGVVQSSRLNELMNGKRDWTVDELTQEMEISHGSVVTLPDANQYRRSYARWVPHVLTEYCPSRDTCSFGY